MPVLAIRERPSTPSLTREQVSHIQGHPQRNNLYDMFTLPTSAMASFNLPTLSVGSGLLPTSLPQAAPSFNAAGVLDDAKAKAQG